MQLDSNGSAIGSVSKFGSKENLNASQLKFVVGLIVLLILSGWIFFTALGNFPLFNPDEALYAEPAREMLVGGDYLTTTFNYAVRYTKPPLCIWAMAASYQAFGINEFAARLFSAVCASILLVSVYLFITRYVSCRAAFWGCLTLLSAPLFVVTGRQAITDMPLACFMALSLLAFYHSYKQEIGIWRWVGYVLIGLAVMTKGPVGIVLPVLVLTVYHVIAGDLKQAVIFYKPWWGLLIVGGIALPWFITEIVVTKGAYFQDFIMRENFQRFTSVVDKHKGAWWYQLAALFGGYLPWSLFLPQAIYSLVNPDLITDFKKSVETIPENLLGRFRRFCLMGKKGDLCLFALCFVLVTVGFFSLSVSKLMTYTLPAFPALAILLALEFELIVEQDSFRRLAIPITLWLITCSGLGVFGHNYFAAFKHVPYEVIDILNKYLSFQCFSMLIVLALVIFKRLRAGLNLFIVLTLLSSVFFGYRVLVELSQKWEGPIVSFSRFAALSKEPIFVYKIRKPSITFYAQRKIELSPNQDVVIVNVDNQIEQCKRAYVIASWTDLSHFKNIAGYKLVMKDGDYILLHWIQ